MRSTPTTRTCSRRSLASGDDLCLSARRSSGRRRTFRHNDALCRNCFPNERGRQYQLRDHILGSIFPFARKLFSRTAIGDPPFAVKTDEFPFARKLFNRTAIGDYLFAVKTDEN